MNDNSSKTILVVDDQPLVRELIALTLRMEGYRVLEADTGTRALTAASPNLARIDLLVSDVQMPDMHGRELVQRLRSIKPALRVLYVSGNVGAVFDSEGGLPDDPLLQKPFTRDALKRKVRALVDAPSPT